MMKMRDIVTLGALATICLVAGSAQADYGFHVELEDQIEILDLSVFHSFESLLENTGTEVDTYHVVIDRRHPAEWSTTICVNLICYPPFLTEVDIEDSQPGQIDELFVDFTAIAIEGEGTLTLTITSMGDPSIEQSFTWKVITSGTDVLVIDANSDQDNEPYFVEAITASGRTAGAWNLDYYGPATQDDLANFMDVVWYSSAGGTTADDRALMAGYLDGGGNIYLGGQNIAFDIFDPNGDSFYPEAQDWARQYFGTDYAPDFVMTDMVDGLPGDPIGGGLSFAINGGDGADNNDSPDLLAWAAGGYGSMVYQDTGEALMRRSTGTYTTAFSGFNFEGIAADADRATLMDNILNWFASPTAVGDDMVKPLLARAPIAVPNPFNPRTRIEFEVGGSQTVAVTVAVYDLRGQKIRSLYSGNAAPGLQSLTWDGRNDSGHNLAAGVYLARVNVAGQQQAVKMTLAK